GVCGFPGVGLGPAAMMSMMRWHATFVESRDGWVDDSIALVCPRCFDLDAVVCPVGTGTAHATRMSRTRTPRGFSRCPGRAGSTATRARTCPRARCAAYRDVFSWVNANG